MKFLPVVFFVFYSIPALCQLSNVELLLNKDKQTQITESHKDEESVLSKIVKAPFRGSLLFYQKLISPNLNAQCGYEVSCSRFSQHAITEKGLFPGILLTADRLNRCTPQAVEDAPVHRINNEGKIRDIDLYTK